MTVRAIRCVIDLPFRPSKRAAHDVLTLGQSEQGDPAACESSKPAARYRGVSTVYKYSLVRGANPKREISDLSRSGSSAMTTSSNASGAQIRRMLPSADSLPTATACSRLPQGK